MADQPIARRSGVTHVWPPIQAPERRTVAEMNEAGHRQAFGRTREAERPIPELPEDYGVSRLVLLIRDPWWIHAYWRLAGHDREFLRTRLREERRLVLRVEETPESAAPGRHMDFAIEASNGNWYIDVQFANRVYQAVIGLVDQSGGFEPFLVSNAVRTPPDTLSDELDAEWATLDELYGFVLRGPRLMMDGSIALMERGREEWYRGQLAVGSAALASPGFWGRRPAAEVEAGRKPPSESYIEGR